MRTVRVVHWITGQQAMLLDDTPTVDFVAYPEWSPGDVLVELEFRKDRGLRGFARVFFSTPAGERWIAKRTCPLRDRAGVFTAPFLVQDPTVPPDAQGRVRFWPAALLPMVTEPILNQ